MSRENQVVDISIYQSTSFLTEGSLALKPALQTSPSLYLLPTTVQPDNLIDFASYKKKKEQPQQPQEPNSFEQDLAEVSQLKQEFYIALGVKELDQPRGPLSFEPWTERAKFQRIIRATEGDQVQRQEAIKTFDLEVELQLTTALRERYQTSKSVINYEITPDKKIRPEYAPNEDIETIFKRGQEWRKQNGSNDLEREEREVAGALKIQAILTDENTQIGTKIISISSPSHAQDTPYSHNFIDIWEKVLDSEGQESVQMTRFQTSSNDNEKKAAAQALKPDYFSNLSKATPLDVYFLGNPILVENPQLSVDDLFDSHFQKDTNSTEELLFSGVPVVTKPFTQYFSAQLKKDPPDWPEIAKSFNAILNRADEYMKEGQETQVTDQSIKTLLASPRYEYHYSSNFDMKAQIELWGLKEAEKRAAGCGLSTGFSLKSGLDLGIKSLNQILSNSLALFGLSGGGGGGSVDSEDLCKVCKGPAVCGYCKTHAPAE